MLTHSFTYGRVNYIELVKKGEKRKRKGRGDLACFSRGKFLLLSLFISSLW